MTQTTYEPDDALWEAGVTADHVARLDRAIAARDKLRDDVRLIKAKLVRVRQELAHAENEVAIATRSALIRLESMRRAGG